MSLPGFRSDGWLPEGHHSTTWDEIVSVFGGEPGTQRAAVLDHLLDWRDRIHAVGLTGRLVLDGSFISTKAEPGDFDCFFIADEGMEHLVAMSEEARSLVDYRTCKAEGWGDILLYFSRLP